MSSDAKAAASTADKVFDLARSALGSNSKITFANVVSVAVRVMELVEPMLSNGPAKKLIVIEVVERLALAFGGDYSGATLDLLKLVLPGIVDGICAAAKSEVAVNVSKEVSGCFSCCR